MGAGVAGAKGVKGAGVGVARVGAGRLRTMRAVVVEVRVVDAAGVERLGAKRSAAARAGLVQAGGPAAMAASAGSPSPLVLGAEEYPSLSPPGPGRGGGAAGCSGRSRFFVARGAVGAAASAERFETDAGCVAGTDGTEAGGAVVADGWGGRGRGGTDAVVAGRVGSGGWGETRGRDGVWGASGNRRGDAGGGGCLGGGAGDHDLREGSRKERRVQAAEAGTVRQARSARRFRQGERGVGFTLEEGAGRATESPEGPHRRGKRSRASCQLPLIL